MPVHFLYFFMAFLIHCPLIHGATHPADVDALEAISNSISGLTWPNASVIDPCTGNWSWIGCNMTTMRVTSLRVCDPNRELTNVIGTIPDEIANLTELIQLEFCSSLLEGTLTTRREYADS